MIAGKTDDDDALDDETDWCDSTMVCELLMNWMDFGSFCLPRGFRKSVWIGKNCFIVVVDDDDDDDDAVGGAESLRSFERMENAFIDDEEEEDDDDDETAAKILWESSPVLFDLEFDLEDWRGQSKLEHSH